MNYRLKCNKCGGVCWAKGDYEPDTNACNIEPSIIDWAPDIDADVQLAHPLDCCCENSHCPAMLRRCDHDDYEIIDEEYPEPHETDV